MARVLWWIVPAFLLSAGLYELGALSFAETPIPARSRSSRYVVMLARRRARRAFDPVRSSGSRDCLSTRQVRAASSPSRASTSYDSYYSPTLRRYADGGAVETAWDSSFVAAAVLVAGVLTWRLPRTGAVVTGCRPGRPWRARPRSWAVTDARPTRAGAPADPRSGSGRHSSHPVGQGARARTRSSFRADPLGQLGLAHAARDPRLELVLVFPAPAAVRDRRSGQGRGPSSRNRAPVRRNGSWTLTYQPQCSPEGSHDTQSLVPGRPRGGGRACRRPRRRRGRPSRRARRTPRGARRGSPSRGRPGGVVGAFQRVPRGNQRTAKAPSSRTSRYGRAAHTLPFQTSWTREGLYGHEPWIRPPSIKVSTSNPVASSSASPVRLCPFMPCGQNQHQQVEPLGTGRLVPGRNHRIPRTAGSSCARGGPDALTSVRIAVARSSSQS